MHEIFSVDELYTFSVFVCPQTDEVYVVECVQKLLSHKIRLWTSGQSQPSKSQLRVRDTMKSKVKYT